MIPGEVTPDREPVISLSLQDPGGAKFVVKAVLDTGFTDFVTLPTHLINTLQFPYDYTSQFMLADGSVVSVDIFLATVLWHAQPCAVPALAAEGGPLVGMSMLYGSRVTLDVVDGGQVSIEELP